ncbi:hypothetical protein CALCODRAFT_479075 [Calocera cornea HHB12733]|uniref:Uncharacterized protein n=1 Tax=Calocera cornea HHB12733 TaxID=1353952 RepID=A0A165JZS1_9BASI|nr:hypothetical protein CALCODRAFT_479075 [Calocera cornea HHB12733]
MTAILRASLIRASTSSAAFSCALPRAAGDKRPAPPGSRAHRPRAPSSCSGKAQTAPLPDIEPRIEAREPHAEPRENEPAAEVQPLPQSEREIDRLVGQRAARVRAEREQAVRKLQEAGLVSISKPLSRFSTDYLRTIWRKARLKHAKLGGDLPAEAAEVFDQYSPADADADADASSEPAPPSLLASCQRLSAQTSLPLPFHPLSATRAQASAFLRLAKLERRALDPEPVSEFPPGRRRMAPNQKLRRLAQLLGVVWREGESAGEVDDRVMEELRRRWRGREREREEREARARAELELERNGEAEGQEEARAEGAHNPDDGVELADRKGGVS